MVLEVNDEKVQFSRSRKRYEKIKWREGPFPLYLEQLMPSWRRVVPKLVAEGSETARRIGSLKSRGENTSAHDHSDHEKAATNVSPKYIQWLRNIQSHQFLRSVTVVIGGTAAAQIITISFSPIITRLYGPEAFGAVSIFLSVCLLITPIANLTYGSAIVLPESDDEARALFKLSSLIGLGASVLSAVAIGIFFRQIAQFVGLVHMPELLLLVPVLVLLTALKEPLHHWLYRRKQFGIISRISVVGAATSNVSKSAVGIVLATAPTLAILGLVANALEALLLWLGAKETLKSGKVTSEGGCGGAKYTSLREAAYKYRDFPLYRAPNAWLNVVSNSIPSLMLAALVGPSAAGFYLLARRIVGLPITVIAAAVGTVFLPRIAEASHRSERLRPLLLKGTCGLAIVGLVPFGTIMVFGPWLFSFVFGAEWMRTGEYARWLSLWFYFSFIAAPSFQTIPILGLQGHFLLYEVLVVILRAGSLFIGVGLLQSDIGAIALFSVVGATVNIIQIAWCLMSCDQCVRKS